MPDVQVKTERDVAVAVFPSSYSGAILRVRCRYEGARRWRTFLLVPNDGEGYEALEAKAQLAAEAWLLETDKASVRS